MTDRVDPVSAPTSVGAPQDTTALARLAKMRRECELALDPAGPMLEYADGDTFYADVLWALAALENARQALRNLMDDALAVLDRHTSPEVELETRRRLIERCAALASVGLTETSEEAPRSGVGGDLE